MQASAGSGKTYNLAKRYIRLLLSGDDFAVNSVIAVTFANKAAVEMKRRVIDYLKKAALNLDTDGIFEGINLSEKEISSRSLRNLNYILRNYDGFNISTIDSFINHILKSCAINAGVSPNFSIEKDASKYLNFALDSFLQNAARSKEYRDLLGDYILQYLISEKTGWFPRNDIYNEVENVFRKAGYNGKDIVRGSNFFHEEIVSKSVKIAAKVKTFYEKYSKLGLNGNLLNSVKNAAEKGEKAFLRLKAPSIFSKDVLRYNKSAQINPEADEFWSEICKDVKDLYEFYAENYYGVYCGIYSKINDEFEILAKKEEIVFLNEINRKTMRFFNAKTSGELIMPEVYYRLSEKYKHFLIDEFQDTNFVQWAGLKNFLEESLANGGTLFYVGDPKQSIYDFRGGNAGLFYNTGEEFSVFSHTEEILDKNYRSQKTIVDFNNKIFSKENLERYLGEMYKDDLDLNAYKDLISVYSSSFQKPLEGKDKGYVEIETVAAENGDDDEKVRLKFLEFARQALERFAGENITVLCRTNEEVLKAGAWLIDEGLNIESSHTLSLKNNNVIKQIISLLAFIDSPIDALSFASFISGEIFQKSSGLAKGEIENFLFEHNKNNRNEVFYKDFQNSYERFWNEYFEDFFVKAGFTPVYELVISMLEKFNIAENFKDSEIFIIRFLELIKNFEKEDSGIRNFLAYFNGLKDDDETLYVKSPSNNGIKIMTMHKAKGLQFPVVILPFLKLSDKKFENPYFDNSREKIKLVYVNKEMSEFSKDLKNVYNGEKAKALLSEINILYVAMTRAEYELYGIMSQKSETKKNAIMVLIGNESLKCGSKEKYRIESKENIQNVENIVSAGYKSVQYNIKRGVGPSPVDDALKRGVIIHFALSKIITLKNKNTGEEIDKAVSFTKRKFIHDDTRWVKENLQALLENKDISGIFNYDSSEVFNEKEIITSNGETFRMDKLIAGEKEVLIFDFKSSNNTGSGVEQVKEYVKYMSEIYTDKKVQGYIVDIDLKNIRRV